MNGASDIINKVGENVVASVNSVLPKGSVKKHVISLMIFAVLMIFILAWIYNTTTLNKANCDRIELVTEMDRDLTSNIDNNFNALRDYYVKTAYNACASGQFKNDFMNICALENAIKQGARCLDFQIYSLDDEPVVAASSVNDFNIKETYNSVKFSDALTLINDIAFSSECPTSFDPIILHLRIKSKNRKMYEKLTDLIVKTLSNKLLSPAYNYIRNHNSLGDTILKDLFQKVVIIVDESNKFFETTSLVEIINQTSHSSTMFLTKYTDVQYAPDVETLITENRDIMRMVIPELSASSTNNDALIALDYGCQFVAMSFQNLDNNMKNYNDYFRAGGYSFLLKKKNLLSVEQSATSQSQSSYVYTPKTVTKDFYSFII